MPKKRPILRKCVACGKEADKRDLIRIVRSKDGVVSIDPTGRAPGRGAYICRSLDCLNLAIKSKALSKSLKVGHIGEEFYEQLQEYIVSVKKD